MTASIARATSVAEEIARTFRIIRYTAHTPPYVCIKPTWTRVANRARDKCVTCRASRAGHAASCRTRGCAAKTGRTAAATGEGAIIELSRCAIASLASKVRGACAGRARCARAVAKRAGDVGVVDVIADAGGGAEVDSGHSGESAGGTGAAGCVRKGGKLIVFGTGEAGAMGGVDGKGAAEAGGAGGGSWTDAEGEGRTGATDLRGLGGTDGTVRAEGTGETDVGGGGDVVGAAWAGCAGGVGVGGDEAAQAGG